MVAETDQLSPRAPVSSRRLEDSLNQLRATCAHAVAAPVRTTHTRFEKLLLFEIADTALGVRLADVAQALTADSLVALPCAPPDVAGAIAYRQEAVGVLNLRTLLGMPSVAGTPSSRPAWVLILRPLSYQWALAADAVVGVREVDATKLARAAGGGEQTTLISGSVLIDGRAVAILDIAALAASVTRNAISEDPGTRPEGVTHV